MTRLSLSQLEPLRAALAEALVGSSTRCAWQLGQQADSPSCAFFIGYQAAIRHLNPSLAPERWGAFVASERGIRNPFDYQTRYSTRTGWLQGEKSHIAMLQQGVDELYVLATAEASNPTELLLVKVAAQQALDAQQTNQPFLQQVPHYRARFHCQLDESAVLQTNAHEQANKPFRYWEDIHITLALAAWFYAQLPAAQQAPLGSLAQQLEHSFWQQPTHYHLAALDNSELLLNALETLTPQLPESAAMQWQTDSLIFKMLTPLKQRIRHSLTR